MEQQQWEAFIGWMVCDNPPSSAGIDSTIITTNTQQHSVNILGLYELLEVSLGHNLENFLPEWYHTDSFKNSGYHSLTNNGKILGYNIATGEFLKYFRYRNLGAPWFTAETRWDKKPFNFWNEDSYSIWKARYLDRDNRLLTTPIYMLWKNGEWVLGQQWFIKALKDIKEQSTPHSI